MGQDTDNNAVSSEFYYENQILILLKLSKMMVPLESKVVCILPSVVKDLAKAGIRI